MREAADAGHALNTGYLHLEVYSVAAGPSLSANPFRENGTKEGFTPSEAIRTVDGGDHRTVGGIR